MQTLPANPRKTLSVRQLGTVDISGIRDAIHAIHEDVWNAEDAGKPNRFQSLDRTQHIVFRFVSSFDDWKQSFDRPIWDEWRERIAPVLQQATAPYGYARGEFPRIMLARMAPGGVIQKHVDSNPAARWPHKIHVPIQTNDQVQFYVEPETYYLEAGQAYEVNNLGPHAVANQGTTSRVHLIFEYYDLDQ
jgi:hypothetical protein